MKRILLIVLILFFLIVGCDAKNSSIENDVEKKYVNKKVQDKVNRDTNKEDNNIDTHSNDKNIDINIDLIKVNYEKALKEIGKLSEKKEITKDMLYYGEEITFTQSFEDKTTITISEKGYGIAINEGDYMKVIDVIEGDRNEIKIDLNEIRNKVYSDNDSKK